MATWSAANERLLARTTAAIALITLNLFCRHALRPDRLAVNPAARLEPGEEPLREEWLAMRFKGPDDFVFTTRTGRARDYRHVGANFWLAVRRSGVRGAGRPSLHSLRHGFASLLISKGLNVMFISRQLGHANPTATMEV